MTGQGKNRIAVIDQGRVVEEGATADVFANPQSDVTRELLGFGETSPQRRASAPEASENAEGGDC